MVVGEFLQFVVGAVLHRRGPLSKAGVLTPMPQLGRCLPDPLKAGAERNLTVIATSPRAPGI